MVKHVERDNKKNLVDKSLPIKDLKLVEEIKQELKKKEDYRVLLAFLLAINTGLKITDLLKLEVGDIKNKDILTFKESISDEILTYVLTDEIKEIASIVVADRKKDDYLFKSKFGNRYSRIDLYHSFNDICKDLKIEDKYSLVSWRKTFAYHYYKLTGDLVKIMALFHQTSVQQAYEFIDEEHNMTLDLDRRFAL